MNRYETNKQTNKQTQCNPFKQTYLKYFHAQQVRLNQYYNSPHK